MSDPEFKTATPLRYRSTARPCSRGFDGIRQFARGGRRAPNKPLLLLYALARLKHDRQTEIRFNAAEELVQLLLRVYGPWGASARVSYPYSRLVGDSLWQLSGRADLFDAGGNIREGVARGPTVPSEPRSPPLAPRSGFPGANVIAGEFQQPEPIVHSEFYKEPA